MSEIYIPSREKHRVVEFKLRPMSGVSSVTPNHQITVTRGILGAETSLIIENETGDRINSKSIEIIVQSPEGVYVDIGQSIGRGSKSILLEGIDSGERIRVPVFIEVAMDRDISTEEVKFIIRTETEVEECSLRIRG